MGHSSSENHGFYKIKDVCFSFTNLKRRTEAVS